MFYVHGLEDSAYVRITILQKLMCKVTIRAIKIITGVIAELINCS